MKDKVELFDKKDLDLSGKNYDIKKEALLDIYKSYSKDNIFKYDEKDILNSSELLYQKIFTKSFFEEKKLILIQYTTEKITKFIDDLTKKILVIQK